MPASLMGEKIRALRKSAKLTLEELAARTDSSKSYIWDIENRAEAKPSAEKLKKIAEVLDAPPDYFLNDNQVEITLSDQETHFFRKYQGLTPEKKRTLERILRAIDDE